MKEVRQHSWKKQIIIFLIGQNISLFGSSLVQFAIIWHVTMTTQSGLMMSISVACSFIPAFLISPFAGVWADRYNKKVLIIISDSMIALATLALAIVYSKGYQHISLLFIVLSIRSFGAGIQMPSIQSLIPNLVPSNYLMQVNGYSGSVLSFVNLASPMISGALLAFSPLYVIFYIDVVTAIIGVSLFALFVKVPHYKRSIIHTSSPFSDIKSGLSYIASHGYIKILFALLGAYYVLISPIAFLTPLQISRNFGNDVWRLGALEVFYSSGMILGGISVAFIGRKFRAQPLILISMSIVSLVIFSLTIVSSFSLYLALIVLSGIAIPHIHTPITTILQQKVESTFRGRVFSVETMISTSLMPLAMIIFGPLSDIISIESILLISAIFMVFLIIFLIINKNFQSIDSGEKKIIYD